MRNSSLLTFSFVAIACPLGTDSFISPNPSSKLTNSVKIFATRREVLTGFVASSLLVSTPVLAKEKKELASRENVQAAFDALRFELNDSDGSVAKMQTAIDNKDWEGLMDITKSYDQILRKGKIGRAKSFLSTEEKSAMTLTANAITFDLIGMNRNARPGQENQAEANRYLGELRKDLQTVINAEKNVVYDE